MELDAGLGARAGGRRAARADDRRPRLRLRQDGRAQPAPGPRRLGDLRLLGCPVLLGTSRKSTLSTVLGGRPAEERIVASAASVAVAVACGAADFVRVHDVRETRDAVLVAEAIRQAREAGLLFGTGPSSSLPPDARRV